MENNILFITRVDRTYLVQKLVQYIDKNYQDKKIIVASDDSFNCAIKYAHEFVNLDNNNPEEHIKQLIKVYHVGGIFVASNYDLKLILQIKTWLQENGIKWFAPDEETLSICLSKQKSHNFLSNIGILVPPLFKIKELEDFNQFPVILKPSDGQGSFNVVEASSVEEVLLYSHVIKDMIIEKKIFGKEYTVDCFNDFNGNMILCVPRLRLSILGARASVSKIELNKNIIKTGIKLAQNLKITGPWNFQLFLEYGNILVHDINPRIASGINFSIESGFPFHKLIIEYLMGNFLRLDMAKCKSINNNIIYSYTQYT